MIFLMLDEKGNIANMHGDPFDEIYGLGKTKEELLKIGYLIDGEIPQPLPHPGKVPELKFNKITNIFYYDYLDDPDSPEAIQKTLKEEIEGQMDYLVDVDFRLSLVELGI